MFVTAHDDHAVEAFDLGAVDYLLKPYDRSRLLRALTRIRLRLKDGARHAVSRSKCAQARLGAVRHLPVPEGDALKLIDCATIHWLESGRQLRTRAYHRSRALLSSTDAHGISFSNSAKSASPASSKSAAVNVSQIAALERKDAQGRLRRPTAKWSARLRLSRRFYAGTVLMKSSS